MCFAFLSSSLSHYKEKLPPFIDEHFAGAYPEIAQYAKALVSDTFESWGFIRPDTVIKLCWCVMILCLYKAERKELKLAEYLQTETYESFYSKFIFDPFTRKAEIIKAFRSSRHSLIRAFKSTFTDWPLILSYPEQSFTQGLFMGSVSALIKAFPKEYRAIEKESGSEPGGFCKGLSLAFEEAYLKGALKNFTSTYLSISAWDKNPATLNSATKNMMTPIVKTNFV